MNGFALRLGLLIVMLACTSARARAAADERRTFKSDEKRFTIDYPGDWKQNPGNRPGMVVMFNSPPESDTDAFSENLNVVVSDLPQEADLNAIADELKREIPRQVESFKSISDEKVTVAGQPARKLAYDIKTMGVSARSTQWLFVVGKRLYVITFTATPETQAKFAPAAEQMVKSFRLIE
jgi:hypothetical protein